MNRVEGMADSDAAAERTRPGAEPESPVKEGQGAEQGGNEAPETEVERDAATGQRFMKGNPWMAIRGKDF